MKERAKEDREAFLRAVQKQKGDEELERKQNEQKRTALLQNKGTLLKQIDRNGLKKKEREF